MDTYLFIAGAALTCGGSLLAALARRVFHAALGLAMALVGTAGLFVPLSGELISVVQILVYLGAVAIAIMFMLMLSPAFHLRLGKRNLRKMITAAVIALSMIVPLFIMVAGAGLKLDTGGFAFEPLREIGRLMLSDFIFPFEIISLVLTVAIIGAIVIARNLPAPPAPEEPEAGREA